MDFKDVLKQPLPSKRVPTSLDEILDDVDGEDEIVSDSKPTMSPAKANQSVYGPGLMGMLSSPVSGGGAVSTGCTAGAVSESEDDENVFDFLWN